MVTTKSPWSNAVESFHFRSARSSDAIPASKVGNPCSASKWKIGILLPKLFRPAVRKNCSSDREKLLKFEAEGRKFTKKTRIEEFVQIVKGQNKFW